MDQSRKYDAIVVLANLMDVQGVLNEESKDRMNAAVEELQKGSAPVVLTCGWPYRPDIELPIADAMARYATEYLNVNPETILLERNSRDTVGDAVFSKRNFAVQYGWTRVLVVTSSYHRDRTQEIFTFVYGPSFHVETRGAKSEMNTALAASEKKSLAAFRSTFQGITPGDDEAIYQRLRIAHPFYNGSVYKQV